ncbi:MAG: hypothetical protein HOP12_04095 [Candidatus Eisenbacteria bacterium]|uniref:Glycoside hydrolase family 5 domain-containing protein n=1 Tax=Eiseniibacteriota bacterium TaxID=2212470 RepID=A0A849SL76_UNCEI|nr:hypothetical protein [Candidatus Eisenbacteria bacterium]
MTCGRLGLAVCLVAILMAPGFGRAADTVAPLQPPRLSRDAMEALLGGDAAFRFVYGTADPSAAPALRRRALRIASRLFGSDSTRVISDLEATREDLAAHSVFLIGGPRENRWTARLAPALPVVFEAVGFCFQGRSYREPRDVLHLVYPNPLAPARFLLLLAGNSAEAVGDGGGPLFGDEDWRIHRDRELLRSGRFAHTPRPWTYSASLDRDLLSERQQFARSLKRYEGREVTVRSAGDATRATRALASAEALLARLDAAGFGAAAERPVVLTLYSSLEHKGLLTRDTRPEHVERAGVAHAALPASRTSDDLESVASARLAARGARLDSRFFRAGGIWWARRFEGEPLAQSVSRLYHGRVWPRAFDAARVSKRWRSPLILEPARAVLLGALLEVAGRRAPLAWNAWLASPAPGTLDSLARRAGVSAVALEKRYAAISDSLARSGVAAMRREGPRPWRAADGFQRGACLAHRVSLEQGYASRACAEELGRLRGLGVDWISLTPFGFLPGTGSPEIWPSADARPDGENDESLVECAARARALGLKVWLTPHLWTRGWVGELALSNGDWARFFEGYREFLLHYAILAQRERLEGLVVGHELASSSSAFPDRWRGLIADARRIYTGTLSYGANWGDEVRTLPFWDAVDVIGVSFYEPLVASPTRDPNTLREGARKALARLREVARASGRPVLLLEAGYPSLPNAAVKPWEEGPGPPDLETQRACYEALVDALDSETWVAGVYVWKWFSSARASGAGDPSFSPRGKPAERVIARAFAAWQGRPVSVPRPNAPRSR